MNPNSDQIPDPSEEIIGYIQTDNGTLVPIYAFQMMDSLDDEDTDYDGSEPIE